MFKTHLPRLSGITVLLTRNILSFQVCDSYLEELLVYVFLVRKIDAFFLVVEDSKFSRTKQPAAE